MNFRVSNLSELKLSIEDIYLQLITCSENEFAMSDGGTLVEERINLGSVKFDNNVQKIGGANAIYTIKEERTGFFNFQFDTQVVEKEKNSDCNFPTLDMDKPQKGDVYLLMKMVNPTNGKSFVVRRKI